MLSANPNDTLGAVFLGYSFSTLIYGITLVQHFLYATSSRRKVDAFCLKAFVVVLFIMDTAHTILGMIGTYQVYVLGLIRYVPATGPFLSGCQMLDEQGAFGVIIMVLSQLFFARYMWKSATLARFPRRIHILAPIAITFFAIFSFVVNAVITVKNLILRKNNTLQSVSLEDPQFKKWWLLSYTTSMACLIIILASMIALVRRSRKGFPRASILNLVILFAISTGSVTTLLTLAAFIQYAADSSIIFYLGLHILIPKSYTNSVLATLNSRDYVQEKVLTQEWCLPTFGNATIRTHVSHEIRKSITEEQSIRTSETEQVDVPSIEREPPTRTCTPSPIIFAERPSRQHIHPDPL